MFKDFTWQAFLMGLIASVVGFASSFAVVVSGLIAVGASPEQASSGLMAGAIAMGVASIVLGMMTKMPIAAATDEILNLKTSRLRAIDAFKAAKS